MVICVAPAAWPKRMPRQIGISSAPANTGKQMCGSSVAVIASCTSRSIGTTERFPRFIYRSGVLRKNSYGSRLQMFLYHCPDRCCQRLVLCRTTSPLPDCRRCRSLLLIHFGMFHGNCPSYHLLHIVYPRPLRRPYAWPAPHRHRQRKFPAWRNSRANDDFRPLSSRTDTGRRPSVWSGATPGT